MRSVLRVTVFFTLLIAIGVHADSSGIDRITLEGTIFDEGSAVLKKEGLPALKPLFEELQSDPSLKVTIETHVAATAEPDKDLLLTRMRSQALSNWFVAQGVESERITPVGYGSTRPIVENQTKDGRAGKPTRIDIVKTRGGFPVAEFSSTRFQFEPVVDGTDINHDYIVRNTGTAELLVKEVKTG